MSGAARGTTPTAAGPTPPPPPPPLQPGQIAEAVEVGPDELTAAFRAALVPAGAPASVVWRAADAEVIAHLGGVKVGVADGFVIAAIQLQAAEAGPADVTVPFAVGSPTRLASMFAATERRPRGPAELVDRWGEAVIAALWRALLQVSRTLAANAGLAQYGRPLVDVDGQPLVPVQLVAQPNQRLAVVPQARHPLDRVPRP